MTEHAKILIVEDDAKTADALRRGLKLEGYDVTVRLNGMDGYEALSDNVYDIVVLDWMLPGRSGIEIIESLKPTSRPPILLLTARDTVDDRVLGLNSGADDYLIKPFAFVELLARVRALLRRSETKLESCYQLGELSMDLVSRRVWRGGEEICLTPREFEMLAYLFRYQKQVVSRRMLLHDVWRESNRLTSLDNVIDVHFARLRRKVDGDRKQRLIHTVRGVGFVLREESNL